MPSSLQTLDTSFPKIDNHQTTEENLGQITNYLYMLLENLKYTLGNLGEGNFNDSELDSIGRHIREPVLIRLEDTDKNIADLNVEASRIYSRLENAEGNISTLNATAQGLYSRIEGVEGNITTLNVTSQNLLSQITGINGSISTLQQTSQTLSSSINGVQGQVSALTQTAESLSSKISNAEGSLSSLTQTTSAISGRVSDAEGNISTLQQTANGLATQITGIDGSVSALRQTVNGMTLSVSNSGTSSTISLVKDGASISSQTIQLTGVVTFSDLSTSGKTAINGSNITTGSINASLIKTGSLDASSLALDGLLALVYNNITYGYIGVNTNKGGPVISDASMSNFFVATSSTAKMSYYDKNSVYASSNHVALQYNTTNYVKFNGAALYSENAATLGTATYKWGQGYSTASTFNTSDRNQKHDIEDLDERYLALFDRLRPVRYKFNDGTSGRYHVGFIAQEVEDAMALSGIDSQEFGGFGKDVHEETGEDIYMLRYEEFIAILAAKIKRLEAQPA